MRVLRQIYEVMMRELQILRQNHIYRFCMVLFPILVIIFFTTMCWTTACLPLCPWVSSI